LKDSERCWIGCRRILSAVSTRYRSCVSSIIDSTSTYFTGQRLGAPSESRFGRDNIRWNRRKAFVPSHTELQAHTATWTEYGFSHKGSSTIVAKVGGSGIRSIREQSLLRYCNSFLIEFGLFDQAPSLRHQHRPEGEHRNRSGDTLRFEQSPAQHGTRSIFPLPSAPTGTPRHGPA